MTGYRVVFALILAASIGDLESIQANDPQSSSLPEARRSTVAAEEKHELSERVSGWRRLESGWVQTNDWTTSSSSTGQATATHIHPSLIASLVILISVGGLLGFEPLFRRRRRLILSDSALIQKWAFRLRNRAGREDCL